MSQAALLGIDYHLPEKKLTNDDLLQEFPNWSIDRIASKTGIVERPIVDTECASDLATEAAEKLFARYSTWAARTDAIIFCTQTPDYLLPSSACLIQERLKLPTHVAAFDINLGCSGYIYGLGVAKGLIETRQAEGVLLLNADTYSKIIHPQDKSVRTLFGDAGTATFLAASEDSGNETFLGPFVYGTDGTGRDNLIVPHGGCRRPITAESDVLQSDTNDNCRTNKNLYMNGAEIFAFALKCVPKLVQDTLERSRLDASQIDLFVFHQANRHMLETLRKKCGIAPEKFAIRVEHTGNTVSASIPLALSQLDAESKLAPGMRLMLVGFGVGYSWGATILRWTTGSNRITEVVAQSNSTGRQPP